MKITQEEKVANGMDSTAFRKDLSSQLDQSLSSFIEETNHSIRAFVGKALRHGAALALAAGFALNPFMQNEAKAMMDVSDRQVVQEAEKAKSPFAQIKDGAVKFVREEMKDMAEDAKSMREKLVEFGQKVGFLADENGKFFTPGQSEPGIVVPEAPGNHPIDQSEASFKIPEAPENHPISENEPTRHYLKIGGDDNQKLDAAIKYRAEWNKRAGVTAKDENTPCEGAIGGTLAAKKRMDARNDYYMSKARTPNEAMSLVAGQAVESINLEFALSSPAGKARLAQLEKTAQKIAQADKIGPKSMSMR